LTWACSLASAKWGPFPNRWLKDIPGYLPVGDMMWV